jgi:hypothetical protein
MYYRKVRHSRPGEIRLIDHVGRIANQIVRRGRDATFRAASYAILNCDVNHLGLKMR